MQLRNHNYFQNCSEDIADFNKMSATQHVFPWNWEKQYVQ